MPTHTVNTMEISRVAVVRCWHELPRTILAGVLVTLSAVPTVVAYVSGAPPWLIAITCVTPALALTGLAAFAADVARGHAARIARMKEVDPVLAAVTAGGAALSIMDGPEWIGAITTAVMLLVLPSAFAYGAVRKRDGLRALRGGLILAVTRPSWALTLAALGCLGGFAAAATGGVLAPLVPPLLLAVAAAQTSTLLDQIDEMQKST